MQEEIDGKVSRYVEMNVLHVLGEYPKVSEIFIKDLVQEISSFDGVVSKILAIKGCYGETEDPVIGIKRPFNSRRMLVLLCILKNPIYFVSRLNLGLRLAVENVISRESVTRLGSDYIPDLVIVHFATLYKYVSPLVAKSSLGAKVFFRGFELNTRTGLSISDFNEIIRMPKAEICAVSTQIASVLEKKAPSNRVRVVRSGLNTSRYEFSEKVSTGNPFIFVQVGRLVPKKGVSISLDWLAYLSRTRPELDWRFRIIGDGVEYRFLNRKINSLGLSSRVELLGSLGNHFVRNEIANADVLLSPNVIAPDGDAEGVPNVIKEAMLLGTPIICSHFAGNLELVEQGKTGFINDIADLEGFLEALDRIVSREGLRDILKAAREKVVQEYAVSKVARELLFHKQA